MSNITVFWFHQSIFTYPYTVQESNIWHSIFLIKARYALLFMIYSQCLQTPMICNKPDIWSFLNIIRPLLQQIKHWQQRGINYKYYTSEILSRGVRVQSYWEYMHTASSLASFIVPKNKLLIFVYLVLKQILELCEFYIQWYYHFTEYLH